MSLFCLRLDLGADDYLAKPFGMMEMVSRVKAVLRRAAPEQTEYDAVRKSFCCKSGSIQCIDHQTTDCIVIFYAPA